MVLKTWQRQLKPIWHRLRLTWQSRPPSSYPLISGAIATIAVLGLGQIGLWQPLERLSYNTLFQLRELANAAPGWDAQIAVIAIDEKSLQQFGQFPWRRDRYTQLLEVLSISPPAVIGFDIVFAEPTAEDAALAQAIDHSWNVVLALAADAQGNPIELVPELGAVAMQGHVLSTPDPDGVARQASLYLGNFPALGVSMLQVYNATLSQTITAVPSDPAGLPASVPPPQQTTKANQVWVNWPGPVHPNSDSPGPKDIQVYSFVDVLQGLVEPDAFLNKIVLVGETATALDPLRSPLNISPPISGVYLHAAVIDNLLNRRLLQRSPGWLEVLLVGAIALGMSWLLKRRGPRGRMAIAVGAPLLWFTVALASFSANWWLPIAAPIGTMLLAAGGVQIQEQREKQQLMNLFSIHVAPEMANLIWQRKDEIFHAGVLQAQELTATVLFMDIRGFTTISEKMSSGQVLTWLNRYFEVMTNCIMDHNGVVDKYIGDAIMAVFGIPFPHTEPEDIRQDAVNAVAASLAMRTALEKLNQELMATGQPTLEFGIGIHTGLVTAGSVGSHRRLSYSVVGDTVNIASRLETLNKKILVDNPNQLLISGRTQAYVREHYRCKGVQALRLPGKETATMVYAVLGDRTPVL